MTYLTVNYTDMDIAKLKDIVQFKKSIGETPKSRERTLITVNQSQMVGKNDDNDDLERRLSQASSAPRTADVQRMEQMRDKFLSITATINVFKGMSQAEILAITTAQSFKRYNDGEEIISTGQLYDQLFYMSFGDVCIVNTAKGGFSMEGIVDRSHFLNLKDYFSKAKAKRTLLASGSDIEIVSFAINEANLQKAPIAFLRFYKNLSEVICKGDL